MTEGHVVLSIAAPVVVKRARRIGDQDGRPTRYAIDGANMPSTFMLKRDAGTDSNVEFSRRPLLLCDQIMLVLCVTKQPSCN